MPSCSPLRAIHKYEEQPRYYRLGHFTNTRESELGLNRRAGGTITNEQLTPGEVKGHSKGKEKEAVCDA